MIVTCDNVDEIIAKFLAGGDYGADTETTGLLESDSLFSLILSDADGAFYFNFHSYHGLDPVFMLPRGDTFKKLQPVFANPYSTWFIHNAKFDMRMLAKEGIEIGGQIHCTYAVERIIRNNYLGKDPYSLAECARRRGYEKSSAVEDYISKHGLTTSIKMPGKKKIIKNKHFDRVPFEVIVPYGIKDGELHRTLGLDQRAELRALEDSRDIRQPSYFPLWENEQHLTKTLFKMERKGLRLDKPFTARALEYEIDQINKYQKEFEAFTGEAFVDSNKPLQKVFDKLGESYPTTPKGNPSFAADVLEEMTTPVAAMVNRIRHHEKRASTYYSSFLYFEKEGIIHADARQAGTETGRMSYRDPNLQNIPKEDEPEDLGTPYHVRESFIPREGKLFYSVDYKQLEYCLMMDYAGEKKIIERLNAGEDFHTAIAEEVKITRKQAKTMNFLLGYGGGAEKLAGLLGCSVREAKDLKMTYFGRLPRLQKLFREVADSGRARGYIFNWYGRRCHLHDPNMSYILPNHLIQGSGSDIIKIAMNKIDAQLSSTRVDFSMLLQVHDELLFECAPSFSGIIEEIRFIMENTYVSRNGVKLFTSVSHSLKNWGNRNMLAGVYSG